MANTYTWRNKAATAEKVELLFRPKAVLIVFDTETTSTGKYAKIIQFSGIRYLVEDDLSLTETGRMDVYVNPEMPVPEKITEITGITDANVAPALPMVDRFPEIYAFLNTADFWVGQNLQFDMKMLKQEAERLYLLPPNRPYLDTLEMARDWITKGDTEDYHLDTVYSQLFPGEYFKAHDSLEDVKACARIFSELAPRYLNADFRPDHETVPMTVIKASVFQNPHNPRQQRIRVQLSDGELGDIYYDVVAHCWACKSSSSARKLFLRADMADIEQQMLRKYGYYEHYDSMDELAKSWLKFKRKQASDRRKAEKEAAKEEKSA